MIFWFSGTGNSRSTALRLAQMMGDEAISISEAMQAERFEYSLKSGERVGLVVPVYYWGIPAMAEAFLAQLRITNGEGHYTYAVLVCGGSACNAVSRVQKYLKLDYYAELVMPDNCVILFDLKAPEDVRRCLQEAEPALGKIYNKVRTREKGKTTVGMLATLMSRLADNKYDKARKTQPFHSTDACTGCGKCADWCPDRIIELREGRPVWTADACDLCLACLHRCPRTAIQYGQKTVGRRRYVHPSLVDAEAIAAARGEKFF